MLNTSAAMYLSLKRSHNLIIHLVSHLSHFMEPPRPQRPATGLYGALALRLRYRMAATIAVRIASFPMCVEAHAAAALRLLSSTFNARFAQAFRRLCSQAFTWGTTIPMITKGMTLAT